MAIDPHNRPVRVINDDTTDEEFKAGHIISGGDPPKNEAARGGFGNRDGKEGYGSDSNDGNTATTVNEEADKMGHPADNMRASEEGRSDRANQDLPAPEDMDDRRVARAPDEIENDPDEDKDEMYNPNSRVGMGQMEQPQPDPSKVGATTATNAELLDPNAQESGLDIGER
ncbi:hypothetical protein [Hymenobacter cavernae]|uniref:Histone chaperone domain-containing protein n=1 Tax=Hymenobacter cavernae TaxID=2044852 RepID=A0ABQ1TTC5_9BACT|nr:hypothetical protein [Hymenobacter cavernae]GGF03366.1 hypothetical protein GCM10011383_12930 [Hymenobacter cavernae]